MLPKDLVRKLIDRKKKKEDTDPPKKLDKKEVDLNGPALKKPPIIRPVEKPIKK